MSRFWSFLYTGILSVLLAVALPACGGDSEDAHSHGGDDHTHEEASGHDHESGDHGGDGHTHEDTSKTRLDTSGMDADSTHDHEDEDTHSHGEDDHTHE